ncbi:hypothetical protein CNBG0710 [Cryptococcus deneoformans B-3501A]|uniref:hypothetical protein n=1 Tax=Cryptococcus deneoformans (strain B-3501A) TaxID=283643 RepID=UPI000042F381|nr:hypothetical protein CNBG0710 [Cryptococcus neoformans var. neoformans B-3501A]EAL19778.1 hypothetical protein CNBG0710 [Cryptococcus neoformans var. neoformans B-3501A]
MPPNLHNLLSSLRSPIFNTISNPTWARMGTKYLRRRLRGPTVASYYPQLTNPFPKLSLLNKNIPENPFAGWDGRKLPSVIKTKKGKVLYENIEWQNEGAMLRKDEVVERGFEEVARRKGLGWLEDPIEQRRIVRVARKKRFGKGPPKKGQGRRSQMKKKK